MAGTAAGYNLPDTARRPIEHSSIRPRNAHELRRWLAEWAIQMGELQEYASDLQVGGKLPADDGAISLLYRLRQDLIAYLRAKGVDLNLIVQGAAKRR